MESKVKRNVVVVTHNGGRVNLDIDRIIGIDVSHRELYFECAIWHISDADEFAIVCDKWLGRDAELCTK